MSGLRVQKIQTIIGFHLVIQLGALRKATTSQNIVGIAQTFMLLRIEVSNVYAYGIH